MSSVSGQRSEVQGTVVSFDPITRGGTVLLDDGLLLPYDRAAFDRGGIRSLRLGQRVRLQLVAEAVAAITIITLPFGS